uniref:Uncharacterized protein n=1 Tax=Denticeps clupeoides TaxID=299321 RepID=A0AAY4CB01_9TELE
MLYEERMCGKGMVCQWEVFHGKPRGDSSKHPRNETWGKRGGRGRRHHHLQFRRVNRPRPRPMGRVLRPVNLQGSRAPGMRAPRNTNQFLMHEKYQMMHMRSDSVGTDSSSDCELDFADMDAYLGVLENARGALLDSPDPSPPPCAQFGPPRLDKCLVREESMQYFPSEDDMMQSEDFMQRDFNHFCDTIDVVTP